jgi:hypothetical protein
MKENGRIEKVVGANDARRSGKGAERSSSALQLGNNAHVLSAGEIQRNRNPSENVPNEQRPLHTLGQGHAENDLSGLL